ncbi:cytochrome c-type biogenesis protein CcmH [Luteimonas cucumeris]|uniref:Cytochrome c-type biogenesis protein CcmH n=1 Tax=Luteimonas cucumeris TaxID=985012 RepID=A0A562L7S4_9GAMM|nr:tetratricopeptide repeat protein [Luteimonas cucumeris]TWI03671.1 cytochrome c-type biogenesis protein CcmH [Luteimonas cucumeris]
MVVFVVFAVLLSALVLSWVLRPLWRDRPLPAFAFMVVLLLATAGLYWLVGTPAALDPATQRTPASLEDAIAQLEGELLRDPRQLDGWRLLGRSYREQQRPAKALEAYTRAAKLAPDDDDIQVEYAEARALADKQHRFDAEAVALLQQVLQRSPGHQRARWFLGIAQRQAGKPADAARTWEPLLAMVDADTATTLRPQIDAARAEAGLPPLAADSTASATPATGAHALTVKVALDPDFASRVRLDGSSVFVIARKPGGPPMPIAVEKHGVQQLPLTVTLDDGDSPMPTQKLSALQEVEVFARLSASGNAMRQEGDIDSKPVRVTLPAKQPVELVIGAAAP